MANPKPLIATMIRTEFGDVLEDEAFYDSQKMDADHTYVPGYSDMRRAKDLTAAEIAQGKRDKSEAKPPLPVRLQWVRNAKYSGAPDNRKPVEFGNDGYRLVTDADRGQPWFTDMPLGAETTPDGAIKKGDTVLMVATQERAARNAAANRVRTERMQKEAAASHLLSLGKDRPGSDPTFESSPGPTVTVASGLPRKS